MSSPKQPAPALSGNRFTTITPDDYGGVVWIASILCAIYTFATVLLRFWVKRRNVGLDDWFSATATVSALAQYYTVFVALSRGFGQSYTDLSSSEIEGVGRAVLSSQILFIVSLCLSKLSVVLLLRRLSGDGMQIICDICLGICALWGITSVFGVAIDCTSLQLMGLHDSFCNNLAARWIFIGTTDSFTEILIVVVPVLLVWRFQTGIERKLRVIAAFMPRLSLIIFAGLHIRYIRRISAESNIGVASVTPMVYQQVELCCSLLSCSIPCLRKFLDNFDTGMGLSLGYATQSKSSTSRSYQFGPLKGFGSRYNVLSSKAEKPQANHAESVPVGYSNSSKPKGLSDESKHSKDDVYHTSIDSQDWSIGRDVT